MPTSDFSSMMRMNVPPATTALLLMLVAAQTALPGGAGAQTPEQRYSDWHRLDFRSQEYDFRRSRIMLFTLKGDVRHEYGENLEKSMDDSAGDFIFIQPGVPHEVINLSDTEPVIAVVARSDTTEWENIVDYPSERRPE